MKHYHQTTGLTPSQLSDGIKKAIKQEDQIYSFMMTRGGEFDAWQLADELQMLITSVRRSLNTLEEMKKIIRTGEIPGRQGKPVGKYSVIYLSEQLKFNL
jgi:response regulator of citrate/malate metabolism